MPVTGATGGIGQAIAVAVATHGAEAGRGRPDAAIVTALAAGLFLGALPYLSFGLVRYPRVSHPLVDSRTVTVIRYARASNEVWRGQ